MARTTDQINAYLITVVVEQFASIGITIEPLKWSKRNLLRLLIYCIAICQAVFEQLNDDYVNRLETIQSKSSAASYSWIQDAMFKFQYSSTSPQVVQLIDQATVYPVIDPTLRIITACSVKRNVSGVVRIKVAKSNPLTSLSSLELNAAQDYIDTKGAAGIYYLVESSEADRMRIEGIVYFKGQYSSLIQSVVIAAINTSLLENSANNFNGSLRLSDIESSIKNVEGVTDFVFKNVKARRNADLLSDATILVLDQAIIARLWEPIAGYVVPEDTAGHTLMNTLTFIAE